MSLLWWRMTGRRPKKIEFTLGQTFCYRGHFRYVLKEFAIMKHFELELTKTDSCRDKARCQSKNWMGVCMSSSTGVPKVSQSGSCVMSPLVTSRCKKKPQESYILVDSYYHHEKLNFQSCWHHARTNQDRWRDFIVDVSYDRSWKGKNIALEEIHESFEESYSVLLSLVQLFGVGPAGRDCTGGDTWKLGEVL